MAAKACSWSCGPWCDGKTHDVAIGSAIDLWLFLENCGDAAGYLNATICVWDSAHTTCTPCSNVTSEGEVPAGGSIPETKAVCTGWVMPDRVVDIKFKGFHWNPASGWIEDFAYTATLNPRPIEMDKEAFITELSDRGAIDLTLFPHSIPPLDSTWDYDGLQWLAYLTYGSSYDVNMDMRYGNPPPSVDYVYFYDHVAGSFVDALPSEWILPVIEELYPSCETGCEVSCQTGCELACESACELGCQSTCQLSCQTGCEVSCETGCEVSCETGCEVSCETGCEVSCETGCEVASQAPTTVTITAYSPPSEPLIGADAKFPCTVRNTGTVDTEVRVFLFDRDTGAEVDHQPDLYWEDLAAGESFSFDGMVNTLHGTVPAATWNLRIEVRQEATPTVVDDYEEFSITATEKPSWFDSLVDSIGALNLESISEPILDLFAGFDIPGWTEPPFTCMICGATFQDTWEYADHLVSHLTAFEQGWFKK